MSGCNVLGEDSFKCTCAEHYTHIQDTNTCEAVDYCDGITCGDNGVCEVQAYEAVCNCDAGYDANGGLTCLDVNECDSDPCDTNATCENTAGSYTCTCKTGYTGNGMTCADVNECELDTDGCSANQYCKNNVGSFECLSCSCDTNVIDASCSDETGACNCVTEYGGADCSECAVGYQEYHGQCYATCETSSLTCGEGSHCDDSEGEAVCIASWDDVDSDSSNACGITNGKLYCWGNAVSKHKKMGFLTSTEWEDNSKCISGNCTAIQIGTASNWQSVKVAHMYICAINTMSELFCWGELSNLGINSHTPQRIGSYSDWLKVSLSKLSHSNYDSHICGIRNNGELYCWGNNYKGQLGIGTTVDFTVPQKVGINSGWTEISTGEEHTCGIRNNKLYCWGENSYGQLGLGDYYGDLDGCDSIEKKCVLPELVGDFTKVSLGTNSSCAKNLNNQLYCWGNNYKGQLGTGDTESKNLPELVAGDNNNWSFFKSADVLSCGVKTSGKLYCSGINSHWEDGGNRLFFTLENDFLWNKLSISDSAGIYAIMSNDLYSWGKKYQLLGHSFWINDIQGCDDISKICYTPRKIRLIVE